MKDALSSATTMPGVLSVMTPGEHLMLMLCVASLAIKIKVRTRQDLSLQLVLISKFNTISAQELLPEALPSLVKE